MGLPKPNMGHAAMINQSPIRKYIWYFLISALFLSFSALFLFMGHENVSLVYPLIQVFCLLLGSFHLIYLNGKLSWREPMVFWKKLLFTYGIMMVGMGFFYLACRLFLVRTDPEYGFLYLSGLLPFILPFFIVATFDRAMRIDPKVYKLWFYSDVTGALDPDLIDFSNSYLLSFEFPKKYNDRVISNFKFKAPLDMHFGELFYNYLKEYNDAHRDNPIEYQDVASKSYGWLFSVKKKSWWKNERILDPHLTIRQNQLQEHDVITPKRFIVG